MKRSSSSVLTVQTQDRRCRQRRHVGDAVRRRIRQSVGGDDGTPYYYARVTAAVVDASAVAAASAVADAAVAEAAVTDARRLFGTKGDVVGVGGATSGAVDAAAAAGAR